MSQSWKVCFVGETNLGENKALAEAVRSAGFPSADRSLRPHQIVWFDAKKFKESKVGALLQSVPTTDKADHWKEDAINKLWSTYAKEKRTKLIAGVASALATWPDESTPWPDESTLVDERYNAALENGVYAIWKVDKKEWMTPLYSGTLDECSKGWKASTLGYVLERILNKNRSDWFFGGFANILSDDQRIILGKAMKEYIEAKHKELSKLMMPSLKQ